jgi:hypothetical protein
MEREDECHQQWRFTPGHPRHHRRCKGRAEGLVLVSLAEGVVFRSVALPRSVAGPGRFCNSSLMNGEPRKGVRMFVLTFFLLTKPRMYVRFKHLSFSRFFKQKPCITYVRT